MVKCPTVYLSHDVMQESGERYKKTADLMQIGGL
jgi:hypothetical protein